MTLYEQLISMGFSFVFGFIIIIIGYLLKNYLLVSKYKLLFNILFFLVFSIIYFLVLYRINNDNLHIYLLFLVVLGLLFGLKIISKLRV